MIPPAPRCEELKGCPICETPRFLERFVSPDLLMAVPGSFRYVECLACRTVYQDPRVREDDLPLCYPPGYYTHEANPGWTPRPAPAGSLRDLVKRAVRHAADGTPDDGLPAWLRLAGRLLAIHPGVRRRARLGLIDGLAPPIARRGRCLEVGPGLGFDLFCLKSLGWEAYGLEMDPVTAANAQSRSGCEVRVGTLASTDYPTAHFDVLYMSHVAEHLPDLASSLRRCRELLAPGGRVVLTYPNPQALSARLYGHLSIVWDPPRHLVLPPLKAMIVLLEKTGFSHIDGRISARQAAVNSAAARKRRQGGQLDPLRVDAPGPLDRVFAALEAGLVLLGRPFGEEVLVSARKPA